MNRQLLVIGDTTFRVTVPDDARITFGPWSPPSKSRGFEGEESKRGTLRIYSGFSTKDNILAVFSGVKSFRDLSLGYSEQIVKEEGATIWKDDAHGYVREHKSSSSREWVVPEVPALNGSQED